MLLTIQAPISGSDLGYLLHKNPARLHTFELPFGSTHVFYPELNENSSTAALLLDIDPVGLVRGSAKSGSEGLLDRYVNDRSYAASSFLSVALSRVLGTAMSGRSKERQELADSALMWTATIAAVPCRAKESLLADLFTPLGYAIEAQRHPLDASFPEWGEGPYFTVRVTGNVRLQDLLAHIYVLIPVLDSDKHYWVGSDEVDKLLRKGEGWLAGHPLRDLIAARYLRHDANLTREALSRLTDDDNNDPEAVASDHSREELKLETPLRLWEQRIGVVMSALRAAGATSVVDLGCGEGKLLATLLQEPSVERIAGLDVSWRSLEIAQRKLRIERMSPTQKNRIQLLHGSLMYRDQRLAGFDAATVIEVVEHLDPPRLAAFERVLFEHAQPRTAIVTTPNAEFNVKFESLPSGRLRHKDHRFEWTRAEFQAWSTSIAGRFGYTVRFVPVGDEDHVVGSPTQMGVFSR